MNHIQSRMVKPNEYGGISKNSLCYFNSYSNEVLAIVGVFRGETCFIAQKPMKIQDAEVIINDFINKGYASRRAI